MNTEKMRKAAKNLDLAVKIIGGIFGAAAWVLLVMGILVLILGEKMIDMGTMTLNLEYVSLYLAEGAQINVQLAKICNVVGLFGVAAVCFLVERGGKLLRKILASMKEGRPFDANASSILRKIAWLTLAVGAVMQIASVAGRIMMTRALPVEEIFSAPIIEKVEYSFTMDLRFVWFSIVLLFLSYVFEYGQKLQIESDETL